MKTDTFLCLCDCFIFSSCRDDEGGDGCSRPRWDVSPRRRGRFRRFGVQATRRGAVPVRRGGRAEGGAESEATPGGSVQQVSCCSATCWMLLSPCTPLFDSTLLWRTSCTEQPPRWLSEEAAVISNSNPNPNWHSEMFCLVTCCWRQTV